MITIQPAQPSQKAEVLSLMMQFAAVPAYRLLLGEVSKEQLSGLADALFVLHARRDAHILVAIDEVSLGRLPVVGALVIVSVGHIISGDKNAEELGWFVAPAYRGQGIGKRLHKAGEQWARERGLKSIKMVAPFQSTIGTFYVADGYEPLETAFYKKL